MNLALAKNETGRALSDSFAVARDRLPGTGRVAEARSAAFEAYESVGLPHRRLEDWKYTDLRALMREVLPLAPAPDAAALKRAATALKLQAVKGARRLVLVDGVFAPKLSDLNALDKGLTVRTLREVLEAGDATLQAQLLTLDNANPMVALNSAMMTDGAVIEVGNGIVLKQPLHVIHIASGSAPAAMFTRSLLQLGKDAGVTLVESYIAAEGATAYQVHEFSGRCDRRQFAARPCPPDRGQPRGLQHFLCRDHAGCARALQHVWHDLGRCRQPLSGDDCICG